MRTKNRPRARAALLGALSGAVALSGLAVAAVAPAQARETKYLMCQDWDNSNNAYFTDTFMVDPDTPADDVAANFRSYLANMDIDGLAPAVCHARDNRADLDRLRAQNIDENEQKGWQVVFTRFTN